MKKTFIFIISNLIFGLTFAQNVEFTKENFPNNGSQLRKAVRNIKRGDYTINNNAFATNYNTALQYYLEADYFNNRCASLNCKIANCYQQLHNSTKAAQYGAKAYDLDSNLNIDVVLFKGCALQIEEKFDEAIRLFQKVETAQNSSENQKNEAKKHIQECERAKKMIKQEILCFIDNLGNVVNGEYDDYGAMATADDETLYFTSRRAGKKVNLADDGRYFENVYVSKRYSDGNYSNPQRIKKINNKNHVAVQAISKDGSRMIVYKYKRGGDLFEAKLKNGKFGKPKNMGRKINSSRHETSASYSPTGDTLYFCSERKGGFGQHDVYMSVKNRKKWGKAINLGTDINTEGDEISIFAHADGKTLYLCSDGHETMGGIDIFKIENVNGQWQKPVNMGYPLSTTNDDVYFTLNEDNKHAYYASNRQGGLGGLDIYKITLLGEQKLFVLHFEGNLICGADLIGETATTEALHIEEDKITIVKGTIVDAASKQPIFATIELSDVEENELLATFTSDSTDGSYLLSLPAGKNYAVAVKSAGYLFHSENFNIPEDADKQTIDQVISLEQIAINKVIILKNIFFDNAKATLRKESLVEIENVYKLLIENPSLVIEISGHTDNVGSAKYNKNLSLNRAKSVVNALIAKGIDASRLVSKGYGYDKPIATNKTEEGRQLNRRTEFKVIKM